MLVTWHGDHRFVGEVSYMLDDEDPRTAVAQLDANYQHGGGWRKFEGFELRPDNSIKYPEDPPYSPRAWAKLRDELIIMYDHAWVCVIQPDRSYEIARMD